MIHCFLGFLKASISINEQVQVLHKRFTKAFKKDFQILRRKMTTYTKQD